jgi:prepilin-type N-terminal cleavage/methylation domain-containing protein
MTKKSEKRGSLLREEVVESQHLIQRDCVSGLRGFTIIEIIVVVVILSIAAVIIAPMMSSAESVQLRTAANLIAADLEYAKNLSITRQQNYTVVFDAGSESYEIQDQSGTVIPHPVNKGFDYSVDFKGFDYSVDFTSNSRLKEVDIDSVSFDSTSSVKFDYLGSPLNGSNNPLNSGLITLSAGSSTTTISVTAVTGYVSIN